MTPMMEQYFEIKNQYKDHIVFYRLGDFYEMFFDDAIIASRELELTLTGRDCGEAERAPMCGVPFHSSEGYIGTLVNKGYKVAICEQTEDPSAAKGLVRREVIRFITPGTLIESNLLSEKRNNYLCSVFMNEFECGTTKISAVGGYSNNEKTIIYFVVNRFQISRMRTIVHRIDPKAFVTISEVADVFKSND